MPEKRKRMTGSEMLVFSLLLLFGGVATILFPPLLAVYLLGGVLWFIYWLGIKQE